MTLGGLLLLSGCFAPTSADEREADTASARLIAEDACPTPDGAERMSDQVFQLINDERSKAGLPPVIRNPMLDHIADDYACRLITGDFFSHDDPSGKGPAERATAGKYAFQALGENLAAGQESPAEVMRVWMQSSAHREIILDEEWTEVGIGIRSGGEYSIYWVQEFALPSED